MNFDLFGTINSSVSSQRVTIMATSQKKMAANKSTDDAWKEIFSSLVIENEPPIEYIKRVIIVTKDGNQYKVSAENFAQIIEYEKQLHPDDSEIHSCKMSIDYNKLRQDVEKWTSSLLNKLDGVSIEETNEDTAKPKRGRPRKKPL